MAGALVRKARRAHGWSQAELGSRMNVRQATVSKLEAGASATRMEVFFDALLALGLGLVVSERSDSADFAEIF